VTEAVATSALEEAEVAALVLPTNDSPGHVAQAAGSVLPTNDSPVPVAEAAGLILPIDDSPISVVEVAASTRLTKGIPVSVTEVVHKSAVDVSPATPAEDRRCVILPAKDHSVGHMLQPGESLPPFSLVPSYQTGPSDTARLEYLKSTDKLRQTRVKFKVPL
jgi:hypothetical protein